MLSDISYAFADGGFDWEGDSQKAKAAAGIGGGRNGRKIRSQAGAGRSQRCAAL